MATLRHLFAAVKEGHVEATPFMKNGLTVVDIRTAKRSHRKRRLDRESGEEERLLKAAIPEAALGVGGRAPGMASHLHDVILAALESGCRKGELLSLQWWQVKTTNGVTDYIDLPADKTKTSEPRKVPITARLRAILDFRRIGPDGEEQSPDAYVFGDEAGGRIKNVKTAWRAACRRAGIEGLNFHDLRHEFTSAMLDAGRADPQGAGLGRPQEHLDHEHLREHDAQPPQRRTKRVRAETCRAAVARKPERQQSPSCSGRTRLVLLGPLTGRYRLTVRTDGSQPLNRGSIPRTATNLQPDSFRLFLKVSSAPNRDHAR